VTDDAAAWSGNAAAADTAQRSDDRQPSRPATPRNFLARREQRRIFWLFMPPAMLVMLALGWVERAWFAKPSAPAPAQIDTRVAAIRGEPPDAHAVMIEVDPLQPAARPQGGGLAASAAALAQVRDDTMFRSADEDAWFQILTTLRSAESGPPARADAQPVSFAELFGQPVSFRGRLVRFRGTLRRLEKIPAQSNPYGFTDYWQGWLEPEGGPPSPIVVYFLQLPAGMPEGLKIAEPVEVVGYFFKRWAYAATDTVRLAPLVLALEPSWRPRPAGGRSNDMMGTVALVTMAALMLVTLAGIRAAGRGPARRASPAPADLSSTLAGADICTTEESLRRLAEHDRTRAP
jgi:hypothetical protein